MTYFGPFGGPNYTLAHSDHTQLDKLRSFRRYIRKLIINLYVEVVPLREQLRVQMTLECIPTQVEQTQVEQTQVEQTQVEQTQVEQTQVEQTQVKQTQVERYTVQAEHSEKLGWTSEKTVLQQGVADYIKRHAQAHVDDNEKNFKFTLNGLSRLLSELPSIYDPPRD